jgi:predicted DsbA family dithiol-disulfide isomerase
MDDNELDYGLDQTEPGWEKWGIISLAIIAGFVVVGLVLLVGIIGGWLLKLVFIQPSGEIISPPERHYPLAMNNSLGDPHAPVVIEQFSDFQCSHCLNFYNETEEELITRFVETGKLYYVFRSFGDFLGSESLAAAEAMYCAGDQEMLWEYREMIFLNFSTSNSGGYSTNRLIAFAERSGMDTEEFSSCLKGNNYRSRAQLDKTDGIAQGVQGTPSFLINGKLITGGYSIENLELEINLALSAGNENTRWRRFNFLVGNLPLKPYQSIM